MIIQDIYEHYCIPPFLQLHMLRVAAVMKKLCDHREGEPIDRDALISAALIHDLGNIVKVTFDGSLTALFKKEDIPTLKKIKTEFIQRYGSDDHHANNAIAQELKVSANVARIVDATDFNNLYIYQLPKYREEIMMIYADGRVGPFGVLSTKERFIEAAHRYGRVVDHHALSTALSQQDNLFKSIKNLNPADITEELLEEQRELLRTYEIQTSN